MKIHELEYLLLRSIRRARGFVVKSYQKGRFSKAKVLRLFAIVVLSLSVFRVNLPLRQREADPESYFGSVLSAKDEEPVKPLAMATPTATPTPHPIRLAGSPELEPIEGKAVLVIDYSSLTILYEKNINLKLPPASTLKVMTAIVALEKYRLDELVTVPETCVYFDGGSKMGLKANEIISVESLLYGLLVPSASDAACALSTYQSNSADEFINLMNEKAKSLGMVSSSFRNASGLDEVGEGNVSTAGDLTKMAFEALNSPIIKKITATDKITVYSSDGSIAHPLVNTNELLVTYSGISGLKTGFTDKAGGCLIFTFKKDGQEIIGVILGSSERGRFDDARKIIDWIFRVYTWSN